eukprot:Em0024g110a
MIRDRLVVGIRDEAMSRKLQLDPDLTLETAKKKIRQEKAVREQQQSLKETDMVGIEEINRYQARWKDQTSKIRGDQRPQGRQCTRCGRSNHPKDRCPAKDVSCHRVTGQKAVDSAYLDVLITKQNSSWMSALQLNNKEVKFKLDTGAEVTAISQETHRLLGNPKLLRPTKILRGPSHQPLKVVGQFQGELNSEGRATTQTIYVICGLKTNLLGLPAIEGLSLLCRVDTMSEKQDILSQFSSLFSGLGTMGPEYEIKLQTDAVPYSIFTPRSIPLLLREELNKMESNGIITKVENQHHGVQEWVDDILAQLAGAKCFSKLDANSGFWQIPLTEKSRLLTTFLTPFGRYCFTKLPFGISSGPELFQKRMSQILSGLDGVVCLIDDILVMGKNAKEHDERLLAVLQRIRDARVTLNREKFDQEGIHADPEKTEVIRQMKAPDNVTELRRFMGMINQLGKFIPNLAELTQPLRELLSKSSIWIWNSPQTQAFNNIKAELVKPAVLVPYNPEAPTTVTADASSYGLGAVLCQKVDSAWKPVVFASRSLTETERRYAQVEKEALAVTWACEKLSNYLLGKKFLIETDHKLLVALLGSKQLDTLPPWVLRFRWRLARFSYDVVHVPGKLLYTADALSRAPLQSTTNNAALQEEAECVMEVSIESLPMSRETLQLYKRHNQKILYQLQPVRLAKGEEPDMRKRTLQKIHEGHQGIERCLLRAKTAAWWPGLQKEVYNMVKQCQTCATQNTQTREPMLPTKLPAYPWQRVASDLFTLKGVNYLVVVDYFSRFPEVKTLTTTTSEKIILSLKEVFSHHGIPETLVTDNGPQFTSQEFIDFAKSYGFNYTTSSPHFPQSNGQAERTVQTVKRLLQDSADPYLALLSYRTTPFPWCGLSPAELSMVGIPESFPEQNELFKNQQKENYDHRHRVRALTPLTEKSGVWITQGAEPVPGQVTSKASAPRSYMVETSAGLLRRNRWHLNPQPTKVSQWEAPNPQLTTIPTQPPDHRIQTRSRTKTPIHPPDRLEGKGDVAWDCLMLCIALYVYLRMRVRGEALFGIIIFYRKFVPVYATIGAPLSDLTKKALLKSLKLNDKAIKAFEKLKKLLCSEAVLSSPALGRPFILQTDASNRGVGAVLCQQGDDGE